MCIGNVIGPLLYSVDDAPLHGPGLIANIVIFALVAVIALLILRYLAFLNQRHAKKRMDMGKSAVRIDGSMLKKEKISQKGGEVEAQNQSHEQDNDFSDLTDMENEDFMCCIYERHESLGSKPALYYQGNSQISRLQLPGLHSVLIYNPHSTYLMPIKLSADIEMFLHRHSPTKITKSVIAPRSHFKDDRALIGDIVSPV
ncbi:hypothetical protein J3E71DRAFT_245420 [Bipolaris maydis]|nr:hypothetical protein J3E73DRAFT_262274 [Bipolaris maydis]KAJ6276714.1 hypothetical protein J3E71DRAFT_245420 [Bipolaris maydis]